MKVCKGDNPFNTKQWPTIRTKTWLQILLVGLDRVSSNKMSIER